MSDSDMPFIAPETNDVAATPIVLCTIFPLIAISAVGMRYWARSIKRQSFEADDWMVVIALVR